MSEINNSQAQDRATRMGTAPILPLIFKMSLPSMFSMMIQSFYNIVDSIYVSRIGESALSAVSLIFPLQQICISVAVGTSVGLSSFISRKLGEKNYGDANLAATNGMALSVVHWIIFALVGIFCVSPFCNAFSNNPELIQPATMYGQIVLIGCIFSMAATSGEKIMQACGDMVSPMICALTGAIVNIIMDPIMIFGKFGMPAMGVSGAAYATVFGQFCALLATFYFMNHKQLPVKVSFKNFKPNFDIIKNIYKVGLPSMMIQSIGSVTTMALNKILIQFSETAVGVLGVYFKLQSFVFMPVFGMNQGVMPILGFNYGAKNKARLMECFKKAEIIAFTVMTLGFILFQTFPYQLMGLFKAQGEMLTLGVMALKVISFNFPLAALSIIPGTLFQATGHGTNSLIVTLTRQIFALIPAAYILSKTVGLNGIWYSYTIAEGFGLAASMIMLYQLYNKELKNL